MKTDAPIDFALTEREMIRLSFLRVLRMVRPISGSSSIEAQL